MNMKATVFIMPLHTRDPEPDFTRAVPISAPISAWEELVGRPKYHVIMFQMHAPDRVPERLV